MAEAVKLAGLGDTEEAANLSTVPASDAVVLDEASADKKALDNFSDQKIGRIFLLGEAGHGWSTHPSVEVFSKPVRLGHLLARLSLALRASPRTKNAPRIVGPYRLEIHNRQLVREKDGVIIRLTEKETALLDYLAQSERPVSREELLAAVWGHDGRIDTHTLETHIYQLRRKLDPDGQGINFLVNEAGAYRLQSL
ncbi:MAG: helix-turn-helix domain-containing protein [Alphaproteobacteria bacterium]|nr:helix-turn-helix domain-containing protein [Alphaproteobacteria bacterium]